MTFQIPFYRLFMLFSCQYFRGCQPLGRLKLLCFSRLICSKSSEAVVAIEKVAEHINEMQRITEQFSPVFHQLIDEFGGFEVKQMIVKLKFDFPLSLLCLDCKKRISVEPFSSYFYG